MAIRVPTFDLTTQRSRERALLYLDGNECVNTAAFWGDLTFDAYMKHGRPPFIIGKDVVCYNDGYPLMVLRDRLIYQTDLSRCPIEVDGTTVYDVTKRGEYRRRTLAGVIMGEGVDRFVVYSGDANAEALRASSSFRGPTISFTCLARFFRSPRKTSIPTEAERRKVAGLLLSGELEIKDWSEDTEIKLTAAERLVLRRNTGKPQVALKPPEPGFSLIGDRWHRAASVLLHHEEGLGVLLGVDEGAYFGCQLPLPAATLKAAYECLMPHPIRKIKGVLRQGEWYLVPVPEKQVPSLDTAVALFDRLCLPVTKGTANGHILICGPPEEQGRYDAVLTYGRVASDGTIYACDPMLNHPEHDTIRQGGWHRLCRNTAVRSYSEAGVD